jgi:CHAT domain-containing protein
LALGVLLSAALAAQADPITTHAELLARADQAKACALDDPQRAAALYQEVLDAVPAIADADPIQTAKWLHELGYLCYRLGRYPQAEQHYRQSRALFEAKLGAQSIYLGPVLGNLAMLQADLGHYASAVDLYQRSRQIYEAHKKGRDVAQTLYNLASLHVHRGQYRQAQALLDEALARAQKVVGDDHPLVAGILNSLAFLNHFHLDHFAAAEPYYLRSVNILEKIQQDPKTRTDPGYLAAFRINLGVYYRDAGNFTRAREYLTRGRTQYETLLGREHPYVASVLKDLAELDRLEGKFDEAEKLLRTCLAIREKQLGATHPYSTDCRNALARLYVSAHRLAEAGRWTERARQTSRGHIAGVLTALTEAEQLNFLDGDEARAWRQALTLAEQQAADPTLVRLSAGWVLNGKGLAHQTLAEAQLLTRASRAGELGPVTRRLLQTRQELAHLAVSIQAGRPDRQAQDLRARLEQQEQQLAVQLRQAGNTLADQDRWVPLDRVQARLAPDAVLIELVRFEPLDFAAANGLLKRGPARYAAWVIPPAGGTPRLVSLGRADWIDDLVRQARALLRASVVRKDLRSMGEPEAEQALRQRLQGLAKKVLHPLLPHIREAPHWIISPDSQLWLVPWCALPLSADKYVIEKHAVSYVVSGRDLERPPSQGQAGRPLVLADPDYGALRPAEPGAELRLGTILRLPLTATEAEQSAPQITRYAGVEAVVKCEKEATAEAVLAVHGPRVLVLSTHGYFLPDRDEPTEEERDRTNRENPLLRGGLLLAGCNLPPRDGRPQGVLTALDVVGLDLRGTQLVVLSACDTGLGEVRNGEGVAGLRQAFQLAGAHSVIATLWAVPDTDTALLMTAFFKNLADGQSKSAALRNAQMDRIRARRDRTAAAHPFYWAAFTLTGP